MKRYGPSRRRAQNASAALRIFVHHPEKTFATISARRRRRSGHLRAISPRVGNSIPCGHLVHERSKSNDGFGCLVTGASDTNERLSHFLKIWRFSAQPV